MAQPRIRAEEVEQMRRAAPRQPRDHDRRLELEREDLGMTRDQRLDAQPILEKLLHRAVGRDLTERRERRSFAQPLQDRLEAPLPARRPEVVEAGLRAGGVDHRRRLEDERVGHRRHRLHEVREALGHARIREVVDPDVGGLLAHGVAHS